MFYPHFSDYTVRRTEPQGLNIEVATAAAKKRNMRVAERMLYRSMMGKKKSREKDIHKKIQKGNEFDERLKTTAEFMVIWNRWRAFYLDLGPIQPKMSAQLTAIESALDIAKSNSFNLSVFIAAIHREFKRRKVNPGFNDLVRYGEEHYHKHYSGVVADLDDLEYQEEAML